MSEVAMIGIDLAKRVFQLHGACALGTVVFRKKLTRVQLLAFMNQQPECTVAMEACATAHCWGREIERLDHTVRLIALNYVKPFVKMQKNDVADAEAIAEAASRPTVRFVALKSEAQQARAMPRPAVVCQQTMRGVFRTRQMFIGQRPPDDKRVLLKARLRRDTWPSCRARRRCAERSHPRRTLGRYDHSDALC